MPFTIEQLEARAEVLKFLKKSSITTSQDYALSKKKSGASIGYQAQDKESKKYSIIKLTFKPEITESYPAENQIEKELQQSGYKKEFEKQIDNLEGSRIFDLKVRFVGNKECFFYEYIAAIFYKRLLYDKAPNIELVLNIDDMKNILWLRSEYLENFEVLCTLFKKLRGQILTCRFAKTILTGFALGEVDGSSGNIGLVKVVDESNAVTYHFAKIDHGRSFYNFYNSEAELRQKLYDFFYHPNYGFALYGSNLRLGLSDTLLAVQEINKISDEEIKNFLSSRMHKLKKYGLDISNTFRDNLEVDDQSVLWSPQNEEIRFKGNDVDEETKQAYWYQNYLRKHRALKKLKNEERSDTKLDKLLDERNLLSVKCTIESQYQEAEKWFLDKILGNFKIMKELEKTLEILSMIDHENEQKKEFFNIHWLSLVQGEDLIEYTTRQGFTINGKSPKEYLIHKFSPTKASEDEDFMHSEKESNLLDDTVVEVVKSDIEAIAGSEIAEIIAITKGEEIIRNADDELGLFEFIYNYWACRKSR